MQNTRSEIKTQIKVIMARRNALTNDPQSLAPRGSFYRFTDEARSQMSAIQGEARPLYERLARGDFLPA